MPYITLLPENRILDAAAGETLHAVLARVGLINAPCGGRGTCGKCKVLLEGREVLACQTPVDRDMTVTLPQTVTETVEGLAGTRVAFDIGTTSLVCCLVEEDGSVLAQASMQNPQAAWGADVISRIQAALTGEGATLTAQIRRAMEQLLMQVCATPEAVEVISVVGNPAMQQLFLGICPENLTKVPFSPVLTSSRIADAAPIFPQCPRAKLLTVPDISGFVGADTVGAVLSTDIHNAEECTLLVDIGTNGEMVLGNRHRRIACATAAGPALEGTNIQFGMGAVPGAIDRVWLEKGKLRCHVIGNGEATGICGSGLMDAIAAALDLGMLNRRGKIAAGDRIQLTDNVFLTQQDIRQVQLAKGAIAAGIRLLVDAMGPPEKVILAGAFGSCLNPESACRIGLLPLEYLEKITAVGNAAGAGAVMLAAQPQRLAVTDEIVAGTEFWELSALEKFPKTFAKAMEFPEDWLSAARAAGFECAALFDPAILEARADVRAMCAADVCRAYGKNWSCPPHCGTLEDCREEMHRYRNGILLQTLGMLQKTIDTKGFLAAEQRHLEQFALFCQAIRRQYPGALCLGTGGCRICGTCAYPEPCRFPEKAVSSMEAYGLFVTQVCRDAGLEYYYGEKTITYTACVLF